MIKPYGHVFPNLPPKKNGACTSRVYSYMWVFPKIGVSHFYRVFHYKPIHFKGNTPIFGNTPICMFIPSTSREAKCHVNHFQLHLGEKNTTKPRQLHTPPRLQVPGPGEAERRLTSHKIPGLVNDRILYNTPWKINGWNLNITHLERKMIFQTSMIMFHVNLQGCNGV